MIEGEAINTTPADTELITDDFTSSYGTLEDVCIEEVLFDPRNQDHKRQNIRYSRRLLTKNKIV